MDARYVRPGSTAVVEGVAGRHRLWSTLVRRAAPTLATLVLATFVLAAPADAFVYWANRATIGRANLDGTGASQNFIPGALNPSGVAVDGAHVYWANVNTGTIGRANLDGTGVDQSFITGASRPGGVAVDALLAPRCAGRPPTMVGTARPDRLAGTRRSAVIVGGRGNYR